MSVAMGTDCGAKYDANHHAKRHGAGHQADHGAKAKTGTHSPGQSAVRMTRSSLEELHSCLLLPDA